MSGRVQYIDSGGDLELRIKAKGLGRASIFLLAWLTGWSAGGFFAITQVIGQIQKGGPIAATIFLSAWLVGWGFGEVFVCYALLWSFLGREIVKYHEGMLTLKRAILGLGRGKEYNGMEVRNFRPSLMSTVGKKISLGMGNSGNIAFDYEGVTHQFGMDLTEAEAKAVIEHVAMYMPGAISEKM